MLLNDLFPTLYAKTFFLLSLSLLVCYIGAQLVLWSFRYLNRKGATFVKEGRNKYGQVDLEVEPKVLTIGVVTTLVVIIGSFICLLIWWRSFPYNIGIFSFFAFSMGVSIGLVLISKDENLGIKVTALTALATLVTCLIGTFSTIDFSFLSGVLFIGLSILIFIAIVRLFITIKGTLKKVIAGFGIAIFIGYLLVDFSILRKASEYEGANNWDAALLIAINIFLDIVNLFLQILDLLSD